MMAKRSRKRLTASSIKIDPNVRCQRIYPAEDTKKVADLKTVGIKLSREQAIHLARVLLAASQE
jgi:sensor domain CHASE-containing protein